MERSLRITIRPEWDRIEHVVEQAARFLDLHSMPETRRDAFLMVVSELVENAIKYGSFPPENGDLLVKIEIEGASVIAEVSNPVDDSKAPHLHNLDRMVQWIRGYQDPFEAYIHRLKDVAKKPMSDTESGLGLVRIAYEGSALLDFFVTEDMLNVSAVSSVE